MWLTFQLVDFWISPLNKDIWMKSSITWVGFLQPDKCIRAKTEVPPVLFIYLFLIKTFHSGSGSNRNLKVPEGSWNLEDAKVPIIRQVIPTVTVAGKRMLSEWPSCLQVGIQGWIQEMQPLGVITHAAAGFSSCLWVACTSVINPSPICVTLVSSLRHSGRLGWNCFCHMPSVPYVRQTNICSHLPR